MHPIIEWTNKDGIAKVQIAGYEPADEHVILELVFDEVNGKMSLYTYDGCLLIDSTKTLKSINDAGALFLRYVEKVNEQQKERMRAGRVDHIVKLYAELDDRGMNDFHKRIERLGKSSARR